MQFCNRTSHRECIRCYEDHISRRCLRYGPIKPLRKIMRGIIDEGDGAELIGCNSQWAPTDEIRRPKYRVHARWPCDSELKRSGQRAWPEKLDRERIGVNSRALILNISHLISQSSSSQLLR